MDGAMFWVKSELLRKQWGAEMLSSFLQAPEDHRLCLGYLEPWMRESDLFADRLWGNYRTSFDLLNGEGLKNPLTELQYFLHVASETRHGGRGRFIIRDADLKGRNRLYDTTQFSIREYNDDDYLNYRKLEGSTYLNVPSVKWHMDEGEKQCDPTPTPAPAPWRRIW